MSLKSNGKTIELKLVGLSEPLVNIATGAALDPLSLSTLVKSNHPKDEKEAFMKLMKEFSESEHFYTLMYFLNAKAHLEISTLVHTSVN